MNYKNITKKQLLHYIEQGLTSKECCEHLHIALSTFRRKCRSYGLSLPKQHNARKGKVLPIIRPDIDKKWLIYN